MTHPYQQVADDIVLRIRRGEWKNGEQIPTVRALASLYPHSRVTLHKALLHLATRGYLDTVRGRGTFVKAAYIKDSIGVLSGGVTGEHGRSPLSLACVDYARGYFTGVGLDARIYSEDPLSPTRLPSALTDDLDAGRLKGLLTIQSSFSFKHLGTDAWRRHRTPHVDIGSQPAPHRVYIDYDAFFGRALALAAAEGCRHPLLIATGSGRSPEELRRHFAAGQAQVYPASPDLSHAMSPEEWGFRLMRELSRSRQPFDALIVPEDTIAKGIAQGALASGGAPRARILIVALGNRGIDVFYPVPVIRLDVDVEQLVVQAAERLMRQIREPDLPNETFLIAPDRELRSGMRAPDTQGVTV